MAMHTRQLENLVQQVAVAVHTKVGLLRGVTQKLGMSSLNILVPAHPVATSIAIGSEIVISLDFGANNTLQTRARVMMKNEATFNGMPAVAMGLSVTPKTGGAVVEGAEKRIRSRLNLRRAGKVNYIAPHPYIMGLSLQFRVHDVNSDGMRLSCTESYPAIFPGTKLRGHLVLSENGKPFEVKCVICRVRSGAEYQGHTIGVRFFQISEIFLKSLGESLLKDERYALEDLAKAGLDGCVTGNGLSISCTQETNENMSEGDQTIARLVYEIQPLHSFEDWLAILQLRRDAHAAASALPAQTDPKALLDLRDPLSTHLVCTTPPNHLLGCIALIPFEHLGANQQSKLATALGLSRIPRLAEILNFYLLPNTGDLPTLLGALLREAMKLAATSGHKGVYVIVPLSWRSIFEETGIPPTREIPLPAGSGSGSILLYNCVQSMSQSA